jgi:hypothetical protein
LDSVLIDWIDKNNTEPIEWDGEGSKLVRPVESLKLFFLCDSGGWNSLANAGGWLDQPDWFIHDVSILNRRLSYLRKSADYRDELKETAEMELEGRLPKGSLERLMQKRDKLLRARTSNAGR